MWPTNCDPGVHVGGNELFAIIGPNGAGKTSIFNGCPGFPPAVGRSPPGS